LVGGGRELADSGSRCRKETARFVNLRPPLDVGLLPEDLHVEEHLLVLLMDSGMTPVIEFFLDAGGD
jgi:hypothetical protein